MRRLSTAEAESTLELVRYACCYHGLFTGPYVSHAEWHASMRTPRPLPSARSLIRALLTALAALAVWRVVASSLPYQLVSAVDVDAWDTWVPRGVPSVLRGVAGFMSRLFYFHASSYQFRWRFYACWLVMEFSGLLVGLAQPANVDVGACELATSPSVTSSTSDVGQVAVEIRCLPLSLASLASSPSRRVSTRGAWL